MHMGLVAIRCAIHFHSIPNDFIALGLGAGVGT
jgi:hypothetical protein